MNLETRRLPSQLTEALGAGPSAQRLLRQRARLLEWEERRRVGVWGLFGALRGAPSASAFVPKFVFALCALFGVGLVLWFGRAERAELVATQILAGQDRGPHSDGQRFEGKAELLLEQNAWVTAANSAALVNFSEGSQIVVDAGTRARIAALDSQGLRMTLEHGKLDASITPGTGYRWVVDAGPHKVTVLGTVFSVEWSADEARLLVDVKRGRVQVESAGPEASDNPTLRVLQAGESLRVEPPTLTALQPPSLREPSEAVTEAVTGAVGTDALEPSTPSPAVVRALAPEPGKATPPSSVATGERPRDADAQKSAVAARAPERANEEAAPAATELSWKQLAEAGRYSEAVGAARSVGLASLLRSSGPSELMLLSDAARLGKAPDLAEQVLLTLRERFPGHPNATLAAFALGRLAFEVKHDDAAAIRWLQAYLAASPSGSMAEGARGRLLRAWLRSGNKTKARAIALEYLQHHPKGHHASVAQSLLGD